MDCTKCGRPGIPSTAKWCGRCGNKIPIRARLRAARRDRLKWLKPASIAAALIVGLYAGVNKWHELNDNVDEPSGPCAQLTVAAVKALNDFQAGAYIATGVRNIHQNATSNTFYECSGELLGAAGEDNGGREGVDVTIRRSFFQNNRKPLELVYVVTRVNGRGQLDEHGQYFQLKGRFPPDIGVDYLK